MSTNGTTTTTDETFEPDWLDSDELFEDITFAESTVESPASDEPDWRVDCPLSPQRVQAFAVDPLATRGG